jgi:hypothetical protein
VAGSEPPVRAARELADGIGNPVRPVARVAGDDVDVRAPAGDHPRSPARGHRLVEGRARADERHLAHSAKRAAAAAGPGAQLECAGAALADGGGANAREKERRTDGVGVHRGEDAAGMERVEQREPVEGDARLIPAAPRVQSSAVASLRVAIPGRRWRARKRSVSPAVSASSTSACVTSRTSVPR